MCDICESIEASNENDTVSSLSPGMFTYNRKGAELVAKPRSDKDYRGLNLTATDATGKEVELYLNYNGAVRLRSYLNTHLGLE